MGKEEKLLFRKPAFYEIVRVGPSPSSMFSFFPKFDADDTQLALISGSGRKKRQLVRRQRRDLRSRKRMTSFASRAVTAQT